MRRLPVILLLLLSTGLWDARSEPGVAGRFVDYGPRDGLNSSSVYAIAQDTAGDLWVGSRGGLFRFDGVEFHQELPGKRITSLAVDRDDRIWAGTTDGLEVVGREGRHSALQGWHIRSLLADSDGYVWAAALDSLLVKMTFEEGIREVARTKYFIRRFEGDYPYQQLYEDSSGRIWIGGRLVRSQYIDDRESPEVKSPSHLYSTGSYAQAGDTVYAFDDYYNYLYAVEEPDYRIIGRLPIAHARLMTDSRGRLWAAGSYGLGLVDTEHPENTVKYLPAAELYCLFEDRQGNIWVGGDNGLSVLCPALQLVNTISEQPVSALLEDRDGALWTGTPADRVSSLYQDREGAVYVGYWNNTGFDICRNGKKTHGKVTGPVPVGQQTVAEGDRVTSNWISDFLEGSDGRFWVVTWEGVGLNEWDRTTGRTLPPEWLSPFLYPTPEADSSIYLSSRLGSRLIEDAYGNLVYATTEAGFNIIDKDTRLVTKYFRGNSTIPDDYVTDLCMAPDGTVWAATRGGLWTPSGSTFLDGKLVQSVRTDGKGRLWAGTEEGLYFIDTDGSVGRVPKELGFPSDIYGERVSCSLSGGALAFGGPSGAASFHPDSLLAIDAAGNLPLARLIRHRYRLNGGDWTDGRFAGLPDNTRPGRYALEEQSSDIFGRWDRAESLKRVIRVPQPLWLRWPFLLLYAFLLASAVWLVIRLRERRLLVKELDMRNRLFSIISHDLRNPVSGNRMLSRQLLEHADELSPSQIKEGLEALARSTENTSSLLENLLLWSLNQKGMLEPVMRDENLAALAAEAAGSIRENENIEMEIPEGLSVHTDRNMLVTCLRNLLDNAVKASPENGKVLVRAAGNRISITDQGPGLKEGSAGWGHGLGLVITRELLEKMGASLKAENRPEGGLEITISL